MALIIDPKNMPMHIAIIMDGNGRWAKMRNLPRSAGHNEGANTVRRVVKYCCRNNISYLTVYAFSTENWKRPKEEVSGIFALLIKFVNSELEELNKNNVKIHLIGDIDAIPNDSKVAALRAVETTKDNTGLVFSIAINYGGRSEILRAVNMAVKNGKEVNEEEFSNLLYTAGIPDPDLLIRTGGEYRTSNFLPWQLVYSEIVISNILWPDFTDEDMDKCILEYLNRNRRFGGVGNEK